MKPARKTLMPIFALLAVALFAACSSDSADSDDDFAGTTWTCEYESFDESGETYTYTTTLYFKSGGNVTASYYNEDTKESDGEEDGTYSVSGSMVTINLENSGELLFAYSSGKLEYLVVYTTSTDLGDTITASNLAGTEWTYSKTYIEDEVTYTTTLKFDDDGESVTLTYYTDYEDYQSFYNSTSEGAYSVSGSTVTITLNGSDSELVYSSGQLIRVSMTFEKAS